MIEVLVTTKYVQIKIYAGIECRNKIAIKAKKRNRNPGQKPL